MVKNNMSLKEATYIVTVMIPNYKISGQNEKQNTQSTSVSDVTETRKT